MINQFRIKFLLSIVCMYTNLCFSQDKNNLDKKYGINKFKLESTTSLYKGFLRTKIFKQDKVKYFDYIGTDIKDLFGFKVKEVILGFYKDKLDYQTKRVLDG